MGFSWKTESIEGATGYVLVYKGDGSAHDKDISIKIAPTLGSNLYGFTVGEHEVVHYNPRFSLTSYYTGNPILYPFPNRLRNCMYEYKGKKTWQMKHGIPIFLHSLVFDERWMFDEPVATETGVSLDTYLIVDENHPVYEGFPFKHTLHVIYRVNKQGFSIRYKVINQDTKELPFGISFHTFFSKLGGDERSFLQVPGQYMMELTDDLLPTGALFDVEGKVFDLRKPVAVGTQDLDNCFTGMIEGERVFVEYPDLGLKVFMDSTDEFTHIQVFTPKGKPFFCVEKQTCSTDAPNLHARGFQKEAHLLQVPSGTVQEGQVDFVYECTR
jgi:aldose 1-epimerase